MSRSRLVLVQMALGIAAVLALSLVPVLHAQKKGEIRRTVLNKVDLGTVPGHEGVTTLVELAPGAREEKHTHPGELLGYVQEGTLMLNVEGKPAATLKAGQAFLVPAETIHWGENEGNAPCKVVATFVVPKDKPLASPAK